MSGKLATMVDKRFGKLLPTQRTKELQATYVVAPAKCKLAVFPKVNGEILHRLNKRANRPLQFHNSCLTNVLLFGVPQQPFK